MIYVIKGEEELFIKQKINSFLNEEDVEIVKLDGTSKDFSIQEMLNACMENSLFGSKNVVLVKDPPFLIRKIDDNQLVDLMNYISNPEYETDLIFYTYEDKFNAKLKSYKSVLSNAELLDYRTYDYKEFNNYVYEQVSKAKLDINSDALGILNQICKRSATLLQQNIEVLKNYPEKITVQAVQKLCTSSDDNDSFELINAITNKDISKTIYLQRKMLSENDSVLSVIGLLAAQLRFLYHLSYLNDNGYRKADILDELKIQEYRYTKSMETIRKLSRNQIIDLLSQLSDLDIKCKSDYSIPDSSRFELFILQLLKKGTYAGN